MEEKRKEMRREEKRMKYILMFFTYSEKEKEDRNLFRW
jgi:hypothetical protein